jgi:hypothetical protein
LDIQPHAQDPFLGICPLAVRPVVHGGHLCGELLRLRLHRASHRLVPSPKSPVYRRCRWGRGCPGGGPGAVSSATLRGPAPGAQCAVVEGSRRSDQSDGVVEVFRPSAAPPSTVCGVSHYVIVPERSSVDAQVQRAHADSDWIYVTPRFRRPRAGKDRCWPEACSRLDATAGHGRGSPRCYRPVARSMSCGSIPSIAIPHCE